MQKHSKLIIVDRSSSFFYEHIAQEGTYAVEVLYYGDKPHSKCPYLKGGNSKYAMMLIGVVIGRMQEMGKSVEVYTHS